MAVKKNEPYMILETKEDFEKVWDSGKKTGYRLGYEAGLIEVLSYIIGPVNETFSGYVFEEDDDEDKESFDGRFKFGRIHCGKDLIADAMRTYKNRELLRWKKKENEIEYRVEQELKKRSSEDPKT